MVDASHMTSPFRREWDADVFSAFTRAEIANLLTSLFGILPQRGCEQRCTGCHASALPSVTAADWETAQRTITALAGWAALLEVVPQSGVPGALIETFRDSDPVHLRMLGADGVRRGIGDYAHLITEVLNRPIKVMTSGARARLHNGKLCINEEDLAQCEQVGATAARMSVSASIDTSQYRQLGEKDDAAVLARTLEAFLRGVRAQAQAPEIYLDVMFYTPTGDDPLTRRTLALYLAVLHAVDSDLLPTPMKKQLARVFSQPIDGTCNARFIPDQSPVGVRISPHLNIGRAAVSERGQHLNSAHPTDWLGILPGNPDDELTMDDVTYRRADLARDYTLRHRAIMHMVERGAGGFLAEKTPISGSPLSFFRAEIDLSGASAHRLAGRFAAPGMTLPPGVNLLVSDPMGDELQVVIPYKPLN